MSPLVGVTVAPSPHEAKADGFDSLTSDIPGRSNPTCQDPCSSHINRWGGGWRGQNAIIHLNIPPQQCSQHFLHKVVRKPRVGLTPLSCPRSYVLTSYIMRTKEE